MSDIIYTRHAQTRTQQRGIRGRDIRLIQELGTPVDADTWLMRWGDIYTLQSADAQAKGKRILRKIITLQGLMNIRSTV